MRESENKSTESHPSDVIILNDAFCDQYITLNCAVHKVESPFRKLANDLKFSPR
jgi:hypothetical protein